MSYVIIHRCEPPAESRIYSRKEGSVHFFRSAPLHIAKAWPTLPYSYEWGARRDAETQRDVWFGEDASLYTVEQWPVPAALAGPSPEQPE